MQVRIKFIEDEYGRVAVLPTDDRLQRTLQFAKANGFDPDITKTLVGEQIEKAEASGLLKEKVFDVKPYTYGQKIEAARKATQVIMGEMKMDNSLFNLELIVASTGKSKSEIEDLPAGIAQALYEEVQFMSEPDAERLLFLQVQPTDGEPTVVKRMKKS